MSRLLSRSVVSFVTVALMVGVFTVGASGVVAPSMTFAQAHFDVTEALASSTAVTCNSGLGGTNVRSRSTSTGLSVDDNPGGAVPLDGNVTLKVTQDARLNFTGAPEPAVASGSFLMTYPSDVKHRLSGTFTAVAQVTVDPVASDFGSNPPILNTAAKGRAFVKASYLKRVKVNGRFKFVPTGSSVLANVEFNTPAHNSNVPSTTHGEIGVAPDAGIPVLGAIVTGHC